jgi:Zn finger protein HypA/HybF involved in hydrogenase expression
MACLEHNCRDCRHNWFDNNVSRRCPECGSVNTSILFDEECDDNDTPEPPDYDYDEEDDQ